MNIIIYNMPFNQQFMILPLLPILDSIYLFCRKFYTHKNVKKLFSLETVIAITTESIMNVSSVNLTGVLLVAGILGGYTLFNYLSSPLIYNKIYYWWEDSIGYHELINKIKSINEQTNELIAIVDEHHSEKMNIINQLNTKIQTLAEVLSLNNSNEQDIVKLVNDVSQRIIELENLLKVSSGQDSIINSVNISTNKIDSEVVRLIVDNSQAIEASSEINIPLGIPSEDQIPITSNYFTYAYDFFASFFG